MVDVSTARERSRARQPGLLSRFLRGRGGTTAVEFGLIAAPFFLMLLGIIETTMINFANATLENGIQELSRKIKTGNVQTLTETQFKNLLCAEIAPLLSCSGSLHLDVRTFDGFDDVEFTPVLDGNGDLTGDFEYDPGQGSDVVLARAFYVWEIKTPGLSVGLSNMSGSHRLLTGAMAFRNEPF